MATTHTNTHTGQAQMKPGNIFSQLIIDYWYKAMLVFCTALFMMSLTMDIKVISNETLMLLSLGGVFISLGEWINHPLQTDLIFPGQTIHSGLKLQSKNRQPNRLGFLFDFLGCVFICVGGWKIIHRFLL